MKYGIHDGVIAARYDKNHRFKSWLFAMFHFRRKTDMPRRSQSLIYAFRVLFGCGTAFLSWFALMGAAHAQDTCPAGQVTTYEPLGVDDSTLSSTCTNGDFPANVLGKFFPSVSAAAAAISSACNGSLYHNQVSWGPPFQTSPGGGWGMMVSLNGTTYPEPASTIGLHCSKGYFLAVPPATAAPTPIPATGTTCSSCKTGSVHVGHPIDPGSGNEFESAMDFQAGDPRFRFTRVYNSGSVVSSSLGGHWQHNFSASIQSAFGAYQNSAAIAGYVSDVYTTASDACNDGWARIAAASATLNPATTGATAAFNANTNSCELSTGQTIPVFTTASTANDALIATTFPAEMAVYRPDGAVYVFQCANGLCTPNPDVPLQLTPLASGYSLIDEEGNVETYSSGGQLGSITDKTGYTQTLAYNNAGSLLSVVDSHGRTLTFGYTNGYLTSITEPNGSVIQYGYDSSQRLTTVTYPDKSVIAYQYGSSLSGLLTTVVDETNHPYATFTYDAEGRATGDSLAGGVDAVSIVYNANGNPSITDVFGVARTYQYQLVQGRQKFSALQGVPCVYCNTGASSTYDSNGYPASATDFNGNFTATTYNAAGLLTRRIEAEGTSAQRTTTFAWNAALRAPLTRTVMDANGNVVETVQWIYNSTGQTLAHCEIDPTNDAATGYTCSNTGAVPAGVRRWTYTYCTAVDTTQCPIVGLLLTATGPRTDTPQITTYSYYMASSATNCGTPGAACYQAGDLHTVTDAQGHITTIASYDADGRPTRITDANGSNTDMTYTPRGWLASRSVGGATTSFTYTPYGAAQTVTDADGVTTTYGYDAAHRLVKVTDAQGNYIQYTLDAAGSKTGEKVYDTSGTLHKSLTRNFNSLGQLTKELDGLNHIIFDASASNSYDANGNLVQSADGLGIQRQQGYDALNRLVQTIDNYNGTN